MRNIYKYGLSSTYKCNFLGADNKHLNKLLIRILLHLQVEFSWNIRYQPYDTELLHRHAGYTPDNKF